MSPDLATPDDASSRFAIVSMGRTGSTLLAGLLNSHPDIECKGELFGPDMAYAQFHGMTRRDFLERHAFESDLPIKGFKMPFDWILDHPCIFDDFRQLGYRIVRLNRTNVLAHLVSIKLAMVNSDWSSSRRYGIEKTTVEPVELYEFTGYRNTCNIVMDRLSAGLETAVFTYENIFALESQQRLLLFLGAKPHALAANTVKQRNRSLAETIENNAELRRALAETGRARLIKG